MLWRIDPFWPNIMLFKIINQNQSIQQSQKEAKIYYKKYPKRELLKKWIATFILKYPGKKSGYFILDFFLNFFLDIFWIFFPFLLHKKIEIYLEIIVQKKNKNQIFYVVKTEKYIQKNIQKNIQKKIQKTIQIFFRFF